MAVIIQRPLKGSRISSFYPVKSLPPLSALDSAFQLQEYISLLIRLDVHDVERIVSIPGKGPSEGQDNADAKVEDKDGEKDGSGSVNVDEACWVYEQLRRLAQDLSHPLITMLQQECTRSTCPEMKAGEWLYLCVAHGNEGAMEQCCAIDYILHTLDSATALLNSPRAFPSRLSVPATSHRHFSSLARRLGRIFAHAYFHHREAFEQAEAESSLYARFLALTSKFDLVPAEFLVIPPRLTAMSDDGRGGRGDHVEPPRLLAASLDPRRDLGRDERGWPGEGGQVRDRGNSPPGPAVQQRNESPRKFGRNRTDTMVYSEAFSVAEELAKSDLSEVDIDREIAAERAAAATEADLPPITIPGPSSPTAPVPPPEEPDVESPVAEEEEAGEESAQHNEATVDEAAPAPGPALIIGSTEADEEEETGEAEVEEPSTEPETKGSEDSAPVAPAEEHAAEEPASEQSVSAEESAEEAPLKKETAEPAAGEEEDSEEESEEEEEGESEEKEETTEDTKEPAEDAHAEVPEGETREAVAASEAEASSEVAEEKIEEKTEEKAEGKVEEKAEEKEEAASTEPATATEES
ncbi:Mob1/phocein [Lentinus tigrinus ALCF2SS1-7]|uniref:Mob1/phocein n=1 Tax=Lentinus tigrinus ALCF2SS1-6 TaxID=1328759 RepID=A0A5C2SRC4_9APHY|nr:Mob1/phocein [Lentinus tigrinus ALCF2SS1-6]RPD78963.1 Mob1/phocein [Lentinus tigrinus ALCF2SS1-7]